MSQGPFLLVGLGNPGPQYDETRHNVGFLFLDALAAAAGSSPPQQSKFQSLYCRVRWEGFDLILLKPQTYMNVSGKAVAEALKFFKLPVEHLIVAFDDLDQAPGAVRSRFGGGHGGHNGVRDILAYLGTDKFHRLKFGIGKPEHKSATANWVLAPFSTTERASLLAESFPVGRARLKDICARA